MRIYVGNLSFNTDEPQLKELFAQFGTVDSARLVRDHATGRSRGFAFVEMNNDDHARAACQALDQREFEGRRLTVNEAKPQERRSGGGFGGGGGRGRDFGGGGGGGGYRDKREPRWFQVPGSGFPVRVCVPVLSSGFVCVREPRTSKPRTKNLEPGTPNTNRNTNPEPGTGNPERYDHSCALVPPAAGMYERST
jgi:cold-inducible RNA-binding protein